jgi:hypothetical protein
MTAWTRIWIRIQKKIHPKGRELGMKKVKSNAIRIKWVNVPLFSLKVNI